MCLDSPSGRTPPSLAVTSARRPYLLLSNILFHIFFLNPSAKVFIVCSTVTVDCCVLYTCCVGVFAVM